MTEEEKLALDYSYKVEPFMDVGIDNGISVYCRQDVEQAYLDGYLAGLEAGKSQWHKVTDGDLPKENKRYLCKIKEFVGGGISYECFDYDTEYSSWKNACGDVIEWCEIPTFDKE